MLIDLIVEELNRRSLQNRVDDQMLKMITELALVDGFRVKQAIDYVLGQHAPQSVEANDQKIG